MRPLSLATAVASLLVCASGPTGLAAQLSGPERDAMVAAHNEWRAAHRAGPLRWSDDLARYAQAWAETLAARHPGLLLHSEDAGRTRPEARALGYDGWGENLYWSSPIQWSDGRIEANRDVTPKSVVDSWSSEVGWYDFATGRCSAPTGEGCGHFTQVVWKGTTAVGCGRAFGADSAQVWACSYDPPGNYDGQYPLNVLPRSPRPSPPEHGLVVPAEDLGVRAPLGPVGHRRAGPS